MYLGNWVEQRHNMEGTMNPTMKINDYLDPLWEGLPMCGINPVSSSQHVSDKSHLNRNLTNLFFFLLALVLPSDDRKVNLSPDLISLRPPLQTSGSPSVSHQCHHSQWHTWSHFMAWPGAPHHWPKPSEQTLFYCLPLKRWLDGGGTCR